MSWSSFHALAWQTVPMPYSTGPVSLARLPASNQDFLAFVRFPPGWVRSQAVVYEAAEEFVILEGELRIDDQRWVAPAYGCMAAGTVRRLTEAKPGCLAWARFHGSPRAVKVADDTEVPEKLARGISPNAGAAPPAVAGDPIARGTLRKPTVAWSSHQRRLLQAFPSAETWLEPAFSAGGEHATTRCDALDLDTFDWWTDPTTVPSKPERGRARPAIVHRFSEMQR